ncbi:MAG: sirohydrochlorin chelatase [Chthonomonadales bacterium]
MDKNTWALVLFSHGSLLCGAGCALEAHAARLYATGHYVAVEPGYLNYSEPTFEQAVDRCVARGARRILVLPYFLVPGRFVTQDLPAALDRIKAAYTGVEFTVAAPIGFDGLIADAVLELARGASPLADRLGRALGIPDACRALPACPLYGSVYCPVGASEAGAGSGR